MIYVLELENAFMLEEFRIIRQKEILLLVKSTTYDATYDAIDL